MKTTTIKTLLLTGLIGLGMPFAIAQDSFGSGLNAFTMDFVDVGDAGNLDDSGTTGAYHTAHGGVDYDYRMGTYEVSEDMITKANTVGGLGITKDTRGTDRPATSVSWNYAARFVNWLNTSSGHSAAYKFADQPGEGGYSANAGIELWESGDAGYDASNLYRNSNAYYFLPSEDEWYKAAYYSGTGTTYSDYPRGDDLSPDGIDFNGDPDFNAVFNDGFNQGSPNDITNAGNASSSYGTFGQGGNVWEWNESAPGGVNNLTDPNRGFRGGSWGNSEFYLRSSVRGSFAPADEGFNLGFRVASIPEPSTWILTLILLGTAVLIGRRKPSL